MGSRDFPDPHYMRFSETSHRHCIYFMIKRSAVKPFCFLFSITVNGTTQTQPEADQYNQSEVHRFQFLLGVNEPLHLQVSENRTFEIYSEY